MVAEASRCARITARAAQPPHVLHHLPSHERPQNSPDAGRRLRPVFASGRQNAPRCTSLAPCASNGSDFTALSEKEILRNPHRDAENRCAQVGRTPTIWVHGSEGVCLGAAAEVSVLPGHVFVGFSCEARRA
jgi:hypothetical protein